MTRNKLLLKCLNRAIREIFLAKEMQKQTKNHPRAAVRSQISLNHLKNQPQKKIKNSYLSGKVDTNG